MKTGIKAKYNWLYTNNGRKLVMKILSSVYKKVEDVLKGVVKNSVFRSGKDSEKSESQQKTYKEKSRTINRKNKTPKNPVIQKWTTSKQEYRYGSCI